MSAPQRLQAPDLDPQPAHRRMDGPDLLRQIDVCRILGISDQTWMRWRKAGRTPDAVTLPSGLRKWRRSDIEALAGRPLESSGRRRYFASVYRRSRLRHVCTVGETPTAGNPKSVAQK